MQRMLSIYVTLFVFLEWNIWKMFLLGIPGQLAIFLWFRMFSNPKHEEPEQDQGADTAPEEAQEEPNGQA